jgi:hypothetical protein
MIKLHACKTRCAYALARERARHHGNEFVGEDEGWFLQDEESGLVLSSAVQHPTGNVEMFGGKGFVAF